MKQIVEREYDPKALKVDADELTSLLHRCEKDDREALKSLRTLIKSNPNVAKLVQLGDIVEDAWLKCVLGEKQFIAREFLKAELDKLRRYVAGPDPSPLETLLVQRIGICWLHVQYLESNYANNIGERTWAGDAYCQKRLDRAHWRYLSAIKTLAQIRRLALPAVQVNIGEKQVNVVTPVPPARIQPPLDDGGHDDYV